MVESNTSCIDVLTQVAAATRALPLRRYPTAPLPPAAPDAVDPGSRPAPGTQSSRSALQGDEDDG